MAVAVAGGDADGAGEHEDESHRGLAGLVDALARGEAAGRGEGADALYLRGIEGRERLGAARGDARRDGVSEGRGHVVYSAFHVSHLFRHPFSHYAPLPIQGQVS